jgi:hypothetical protein
VLSQAEIDSFAADGFVVVRGAMPGDVLRTCQEEIWSDLGGQGVLREDPSTWQEPVVAPARRRRIDPRDTQPVRAKVPRCRAAAGT